MKVSHADKQCGVQEPAQCGSQLIGELLGRSDLTMEQQEELKSNHRVK
jgi:hypothetical protein